MNNKDIRGRTISYINESGSSTLTSAFNNYDNNQKDRDNSILCELLVTTNKMTNRLDNLEQENKILHKEIKNNKICENKLINQFSCFLLIINIGLVLLMIIGVILFIDSVYPFIKNLIENSHGAKIIVELIGGSIAAGIFGIWLSVNKYLIKVTQKEKEE